MRRLLVAALVFGSLGCGAVAPVVEGSSSDASSADASSSAEDAAAPDAATPDAATPDASSPDASAADASTSGASDAGDVCTSLTVPVYHRVNPSTGASLFTVTASEASDAAANHGFTEDHGTAFKAASAAGTGLSPAYRLYNPTTGDRLWTTSASEKSSAASSYGFTVDEGVGFHVSTTSASCLVPVHRLVNGTLHVHRFAANDTDRTALAGAGWTDEGIKLYATAGDVPVQPDTQFSMVVLPDVQQEMWSDDKVNSLYLNRIQWIVGHKASEDIRFLIQVGDLTDTDNCGGADVVNGQCSAALKANGTYYPLPAYANHYHFVNANKGLLLLDGASIPYGLTLGNHDTAIVCGGPACYGHPEWGVPSSSQIDLLRVTRTWNTYFPLSRFKAAAGVYETGKTDNIFHTLSAGGVDWLVLNLELWPSAAVVTWAKGVVAAHPHHNVIVVTHSYLTGGGTVYGAADYGADSKPPTYLRDNLVKVYANIKLVFSGHVGTTDYLAEPGAGGNTVHQFLDCYHDTTNNRLRMVKFDTANGTFTTWVYAPNTDLTTQAAKTYSIQYVH